MEPAKVHMASNSKNESMYDWHSYAFMSISG